MKLTIDNLDGNGAVDYTASVETANRPKMVRKLNQPATMTCALVALGTLSPPVTGARVAWRLDSGVALFTGYLTQAAERVYLGWDAAGPVYRYVLTAIGDEDLLDRQVNELRPLMVQRTAGSVLRALTPAGTDVSGVEDCGTVSQLVPDLRKWSACAAEAANQARAAYSALDGKVVLRPIGERAFTINETDTNFAPQGWKLQSPDKFVNAITVIGKSEPDAYVKDYFLGDGYTLSFDLSQTPFDDATTTIFEQQYAGPLDPAWWTVTDPNGAISIANGSLWAQGAGATVEYAEQIELGAALKFQHGDVMFQAASAGIIGGLYSDGVCLAGFQIAPAGAQSTISALVNGSVTGTPVTTQANHRYLLTTRVYATEPVRRAAWLQSSKETMGGQDQAADLRIVLEVHDVDMNNAATLAAPATVLYDGIIPGGPSFCTYVLVNATNMSCSITGTELVAMPNVLVRSMVPGAAFVTQLVGAQTDGAECNVSSRYLTFYAAEVPAASVQIVAEYRNARKMAATVIAPLAPGAVGRSEAVELALPVTRTSVDCANAAQAMLDDAMQPAWSGEYQAWSDFLPSDLWPGDVLQLNMPSRGCAASVVVREVELQSLDPADERSWYAITFANDAAKPVTIKTRVVTPLEAEKLLMPNAAVFTLGGLQQAEATTITSTQVTIDAGCNPIAGGGFEVRWNDVGWGPQTDTNLVGRFTTRVMTAPRLARSASYWVRQYDGAGHYSTFATLLHVDWPL